MCVCVHYLYFIIYFVCKLQEIERVPAWCCGRSHCLGLPSIFETQGEYRGLGHSNNGLGRVDNITTQGEYQGLVTAIMGYVEIL